MEKLNDTTRTLMAERFGHDTLLSVATVENGRPSVRIVNSLYLDGSFYTITYALSNKMRHISADPFVGVCGEWFTAHGVGENLGHIKKPENAELAQGLRDAFAAWYDNGHTNEDDPNTVILRIKLTDAILWHHGQMFEIDFTD